ncbi:MAG: hypothetical protein WKF63_00675 [Thermomicrobiales bacterium]
MLHLFVNLYMVVFGEGWVLIDAGVPVARTRSWMSLYAVMAQREELHGLPAYFTPGWTAARWYSVT